MPRIDDFVDCTGDLDAEMVSESPERTRQWGLDLGGRLPPGVVVGLVGDLGAGKTLLAGAILHGAGLGHAVPVTSPTFTIMNRYDAGRLLVHIDLYRLGSDREAHDAGIEEAMLEPGDAIVVVEWFDKFPCLWPARYLRIDISILGPQTRRLSLVRCGGPDEQR